MPREPNGDSFTVVLERDRDVRGVGVIVEEVPHAGGAGRKSVGHNWHGSAAVRALGSTWCSPGLVVTSATREQLIVDRMVGNSSRPHLAHIVPGEGRRQPLPVGKGNGLSPRSGGVSRQSSTPVDQPPMVPLQRVTAARRA